MPSRMTAADIFEAFRAQNGPPAHAVQLQRLRQITAERAIELAHGDPTAFVAKLAELPPKDRAYVLARLAQGQPATVTKQTPNGGIPQVWFPVALPGPRQVAAATAAYAANPPAQLTADHVPLQSISGGMAARAGQGPMVVDGSAYKLNP